MLPWHGQGLPFPEETWCSVDKIKDMLAPRSANKGRAETTVVDGGDSSWTRLILYASARGTFQGLLAHEKIECNSSW